MHDKPVMVVGAGSWGTALGMVLARNGNCVYLWDSNQEHIENLIVDSCNQRYLPGIAFPQGLEVIKSMMPLPDGVEDVVLVIPCEALKSVLTSLASARIKKINICLACKGLQADPISLNYAVVQQVLGDVSVAILSGPTFAKEVALDLPTALTIASTQRDTAGGFAELFHNDTFRIYTTDDVIGVQIGGAVKNVMAIAAGISDGLGFGANTRSALITRGLAEIMRLGIAMGGKPETFMGLAGLGDLVLTCTDDQSRNRCFGLALAQGATPQQALEEIGQVVEGMKTAGLVNKLALQYKIEMPISEQVQAVIESKTDARTAVQSLLLRERKSESDN